MLGSEADYSPSSSVEVKNALSCTSTYPYVFMAHGVALSQAQRNFTLLEKIRYEKAVYKSTITNVARNFEVLCDVNVHKVYT
jgi:hypothetical protein